MKDKITLRDKISMARVRPSDRVWDKVERGIEKEGRIKRVKNRSVIGWAAAVVILVLSYSIHRYDRNSPSYMPEILELNDQTGEINLPQDIYRLENAIPNYRKDGRLIPNYRVIWKNPLVPREKS